MVATVAATQTIQGIDDGSGNLALVVPDTGGGGEGTADYPLEIIQPRTGLSTSNRFYKQYPGIEYNVRMGVLGGLYPLTYSLIAAPSGVSINSATGEIVWVNPTALGSPHTITARVTDAEGTTQDITWPLSVTTSGFKFVDSASGNDGNAGTLAAPWATLDKIGDAAASDFIYFRAGTYSSTSHDNWDGTTEPVVWLGYPSEAVNFDLASGGRFIFNASNRLYIDGINVDSNSNSQQRAFSYPGGESNITFRRNSFSGLVGTSGNNPAYLFSTNDSTRGHYTVIQDNEVTGGEGDFYLGYANSHVLLESNVVAGMTNSIAFSPKDGNGLHFIRDNDISLTGKCIYVQEYNSQGHGKGPIVIEYNNLESTGGDQEALNVLGWEQYEQIIFQRNTAQGRFYIRPTSPSNGPFHFNKNVIINDNDTGNTDRIRTGPEGDQGTLFYDDNLVGGTTDNIVDANGDLQGTYRTTYLGTHGHEVN